LKKQSLVILWVFIIGLISIRLILIIPGLTHPERFNNITDSRGYLDLAQGLLDTGKFHSNMDPTLDILRTPGYPVFLAMIKLIFRDYKWASVIQLFLTLVNCFILFQIGSNIDHSRRVSYAAIIVYLISLNASFDALLIMTETLTSFLLISALWLLVKYWTTNRVAGLVLCGLTLGLGALVRPSVFPLFFLWVILFAGIEWFKVKEKRSIIRFISSIVVLSASGYLLILLWQVRNIKVQGDFSFSPVGESTMKYWVFGEAMAEIEGITHQEAENLINSAPSSTAYIIDYIKSHPAPFLKIQIRGILRTLTAVDYRYWAEAISGKKPPGSGIVVGMSLNPALLVDQIKNGNYWIFLGIVALVIDVLAYSLVTLTLWRIFGYYRKDALLLGLVLIALITLIYSVILPLGHGSGRFRVPAEPFLALLAGMAFYGKRILPATVAGKGSR
jgi:4-amino-4-deoxy-L-arabinose transferase-like glycosyltransferase